MHPIGISAEESFPTQIRNTTYHHLDTSCFLDGKTREIGWIRARMEDPSREAGIKYSCMVGKEGVSASRLISPDGRSFAPWSA